MRDIAASEAAPSVTRVSDANETAFSFATRKDPTRARPRQVDGAEDVPAARKGCDVERDVPVVHRLRGQRAATSPRSASSVGGSSQRHGGLCIGASPGELYDQKKFDTPYIRDFLLDRGALADVSETAAPWSELHAVYDDVMAAGHGAFDELGVRGYIMCHLSHSYHAGACLYFTFAFKPRRRPRRARGVRRGEVGDPAGVRRHGRDAVPPPRGRHRARRSGSSRTSRRPASAMLRALFDGTDPGANLNPGKIVVTDPLDRSLDAAWCAQRRPATRRPGSRRGRCLRELLSAACSAR